MRAHTLGLRLLYVAGALLLGCTAKGEDVATTFFDPTANPSGPPPMTGGGSDTEETGANETESSADSGSDGSDATSMGATTMPGGSGDTGVPPVDEQPENGMYSECASVGDCIGLTTCVIVPGSGFCSATCANAPADCDQNPGASSTAPPTCVDDGSGTLICALSCAGGQTCPGGMSCQPLAGTSVCA